MTAAIQVIFSVIFLTCYTSGDSDFGYGPPTEKFFDQDIDYKGTARGTFKQLYYEELNPDSLDNMTVNFLFIGGDEPLSSGSLQFTYMVELARTFHANMFALEHRYFGRSLPSPNLMTENMQFLDATQAIEDVARFVREKNKELQTENGHILWYLFGCGYGGSLAAWTKYTYPGLVNGAVASSPVIEPVYDFKDFLEAIGNMLPEKCYKTIQNAVKHIVQVFPLHKEDMVEPFKMCQKPINEFDKYTLVNRIAQIFIDAAVYNIKSPSGETALEAVCNNLMGRKGTDFQKIASLTVDHYLPGSECGQFSYNEMIESLKDTNPLRHGTDRARLYLSCFKLGNFKTTNSNKQPFVHALPTLYYRKICEDAFGTEYDENNVIKFISTFNECYGGKNISVKDVAFLQGTSDPWTILGKQGPTDPSSPVIEVKGGYHCQDMIKTQANEPLEVTHAKRELKETISKWTGLNW